MQVNYCDLIFANNNIGKQTYYNTFIIGILYHLLRILIFESLVEDTQAIFHITTATALVL